MAEKSLYIQKNVGAVDQAIRIVLGVSLIAAPVFFHWSPWTTALLAAIGGSQIVEGTMAY